jgi:hypothetical protein
MVVEIIPISLVEPGDPSSRAHPESLDTRGRQFGGQFAGGSEDNAMAARLGEITPTLRHFETLIPYMISISHA